ncbi:MAG: type II toxin-antitoxin system VapC family toxin [Thermoplasmata archaeon]|nr:type II toxin-antitoxin system VapC family toxin [Thermoplasmata archaeon]
MTDSVVPDQILTSVVTVYEVYKKAKSIRGEHAALEDVAALGHTRVLPVDQEIALAAADYSLANGLHFADALIYATARRHNADLSTSDPALRPLPGVRFVGRGGLPRPRAEPTADGGRTPSCGSRPAAR